jgi:HAD superfamily hydrolase (TIGR01549 family)
MARIAAPTRFTARAVLLDAFGTLLVMPPPAARLRELLAAEGHRHPEARVRGALAEEIRYYRAHHDRGRDRDSLRELRRDCARVLAAALGGEAPPPDRLAELLVASLRFELAPDAPPVLRALSRAGARVGVVSDWDCSLPDVLRDLGVADRVDAVITSAAVGAAKPDPAIFRAALDALAVAPGDAIHCGDDPARDCAGARAAGVRAVLLDRSGTLAADGCPRITTLGELPRLAGLGALSGDENPPKDA